MSFNPLQQAGGLHSCLFQAGTAPSPSCPCLPAPCPGIWTAQGLGEHGQHWAVSIVGGTSPSLIPLESPFSKAKFLSRLAVHPLICQETSPHTHNVHVHTHARALTPPSDRAYSEPPRPEFCPCSSPHGIYSCFYAFVSPGMACCFFSLGSPCLSCGFRTAAQSQPTESLPLASTI